MGVSDNGYSSSVVSLQLFLSGGGNIGHGNHESSYVVKYVSLVAFCGRMGRSRSRKMGITVV